MVSDWLKTRKKPSRANQIKAVLTTKFKKMAMVFSKQRFEFVRKTTVEKLKIYIYSKNPNTVKSTSFCLNVLKKKKVEENEPEKLKKVLITDYAKVKNKEQKRWQPHASQNSYTFQAFKQGYIQVFHANYRDFKSRTLFVGGDRCPFALFKFFVERRPLLKHSCDGRFLIFFFYLRSKRNRKFKHLVQTKPMGENIINNIMKVSVAGTSLKKLQKKFRNRRARKTTVSKLKKAMIVSSVHRGTNFLNDYDEANEEERR